MNVKKIPLLVRKQIFDELRNDLGEAYVEELVPIRSNMEFNIFGQEL
jgi:hypothetical protein